MSIQIYQDTENLNPRRVNPSKRIKRDEGRALRSDMAKQPIKRNPLGTITNQQNIGSRVQPSRAAKGKPKITNGGVKSKRTQNNGHPSTFEIFNDMENNSDNGNKKHGKTSASFKEVSDILKESPMILSPIECGMSSFDNIKSDEIMLPHIEDITSQLDRVYDCPEYAHDIHNYLKKIEKKYIGKEQYMKKQTDINNGMRSILVDWLVEVSDEYKLQPQTLYLTVNYIDRFLSQMSVLRGKLQLVGAACMLVAAKFEEIYPPEVSEFVYITDDTYTSKQVIRMEHLVLKTLSFNLSVPTCDSYMSRYLLAAGAEFEGQLQYLVKYLCELTLIDYNTTMKHPPSLIVASAVCIANKTLGNEPWTATLEFYTGYELSDMNRCVSDMCEFLSTIKNHAQQAVQLKYKSAKYGCVAQLALQLL